MDRSGALLLNGESADSPAVALWPGEPDEAPYRTPLNAEDIGIAIGRRLRQRRRELRLTQKELGQRAGISYQQVQRYENGALRISAAMVWKLSIALDVSVPHLFGI
jgi:DNA-binding XRE family transcriptional regulator